MGAFKDSVKGRTYAMAMRVLRESSMKRPANILTRLDCDGRNVAEDGTDSEESRRVVHGRTSCSKLALHVQHLQFGVSWRGYIRGLNGTKHCTGKGDATNQERVCSARVSSLSIDLKFLYINTSKLRFSRGLSPPTLSQAMECKWGHELLSWQRNPPSLPSGAHVELQNGSNQEYLDLLARFALDSDWTDAIFASYEPLFVDLCNRWLSSSFETYSPLQKGSALARVIKVAPHLSIYAHELACTRKAGEFGLLFSQGGTALGGVPEKALIGLLLVIFRLLGFDERFSVLVSPVQLPLLLSHDARCVRYLAIRILCLFLHSSEVAMIEMMKKYVGEGEVSGWYDGKSIDYRFFSLWEQKRVKDLRIAVREARQQRQNSRDRHPGRILGPSDLCRTTACFAGCLVPTLEAPPQPLNLVLTPVINSNILSVAEGLKTQRPVLITGPAGAGKTSIVKALARSLNKSNSMLTLHLNDQTDAKHLLGLYTSADDPSTFKWLPGVLTTAVKEGRWVLIEDLDRAPNEVISVLLPLLEQDELLVPNFGGSIRPAPGFRLFATIRSTISPKGEVITPSLSLLGFRHWHQVSIRQIPDADLGMICAERFPMTQAYQGVILQTYRSVMSIIQRMNSGYNKPVGLTRSTSPRDLMRFCARSEDNLLRAGLTSKSGPLPEAIWNQLLLEAIDCFVGAASSDEVQTQLIAALATPMKLPLERAEFCLRSRVPTYKAGSTSVQAGRAILAKHGKGNTPQNLRNRYQPFAATKAAARLMESIMVTVKMSEPCLLVGETGTGKTTVVQELAEALDQPLRTVNLSQQSEASDLLGGFKPVSTRGIMAPIQDVFEDLFVATFSATKNEKFMHSLNRAIKKGDWERTLRLWQKAHQMAKTALGKLATAKVDNSKKRRKVGEAKHAVLRERWESFEARLDTLQKQIHNGSNSFAFTFVEGGLVKAMKAGEWILLDEINLASPETLESLIELVSTELGERPSVLLSEAGNAQKVKAHPNFRLFAAMNPATDVGKRELPWSLRSRFTELYVRSPDREEGDLEQIVQVYLKSFLSTDPRVASDVASAYNALRRLESENALVDGSGQKPHFSLRTLTRALTFAADTAAQFGLRRALYEGFTMSFSTLLDADSAAMVLRAVRDQILLSPNSGSRGNQSLPKTPKCPGDEQHFVRFRHYWMPRGPHAIEDQPQYIITPFVEFNLLNLVRATSIRRYPILLQGPTSSGKTSMIEYLARITGNRFVRINNHEHTDLQEYLGSYVSGPSGLHFQDGALVRALREGHWVVLDELNLAPTDVLEALNRLLDDNRELLVPETQEVIRPHPSFALFATQNPPGIYGGRKLLSRAFRNRFLELHFNDIPEDELEIILRERTRIAPSYCSKIVAVYKRLAVIRRSERVFEQKNSFATLRDLFRWALRDADNVQELADDGFMLLGERVRDEQERQEVKAIIEEILRVKIDPPSLYSSEKLQPLISNARKAPPQKMIWTSSARRVCRLVWEALKRKEPVLLIGSTGTGKTSICQMIAEFVGKELHIYNAHQNTETGDLIGAQRPTRNRTMVEKDVQEKLQHSLQALDCLPDSRDSSTLIEAYQGLDATDKRSIPSENRKLIENAITKIRSLFEWCDGSLITAMKEGVMFLLDEISLADDSVLERLNSVLEPDRSIFLAEKASEGSAVIAAEGFHFLATMNPGGDYGKKELSPALRNRFTEIWVPPISQVEDIIPIVEARLQPSMRRFASGMVEFSSWYHRRLGDPESTISIRLLLSWADFLNIHNGPYPSFAILHGAALAFLDSLGAQPSAKFSNWTQNTFEDRATCLKELGRIFSFDMTALYDGHPELQLDSTVLAIGGFTAQRQRDGQSPTTLAFDARTTQETVMRILRALEIQKPILIEGSPGVGKTTLVAGLATLLGTPFTRINLSDQTDLMDLFGSDLPAEGEEAGHFSWRDGPFLSAMQRGEWVLLDEMNLASQSVLEGLNACLDHRGQVFVPELDQTFSKHPNFKLFAAQNPYGQGGGRKGLPASFVDRFTVVYADLFSADDLLLICQKLHPETPVQSVRSIIRFVSEANQALLSGLASSNVSWTFNLRDILRWLQLLGSQRVLTRGAIPADFLPTVALSRFRDGETATQVKRIAETTLDIDSRSRTITRRTSPIGFQCGQVLLPRNHVHQPRGRDPGGIDSQILESTMIAIQESWPCLLVGPSGAGKSRIIEYLGSVTGASIVTLSMNPDMDSMDLVGGYEQLDHERHVLSFQKRLRDELAAIFSHRLTTDDDSSFFAECLNVMQSLQPVALPLIHSLLSYRAQDGSFIFPMFLMNECTQLMERSLQSTAARFEWVDGLIVRAAENGLWLVIDNANLCNPSVLDRLNSLMEPNGALYLNEHRGKDGAGKLVRPHPDFRLFLTIDPRYGELSRAMHNRCLELYVSPRNAAFDVVQESLSAESYSSRFECFGWFDWKSLGDHESRVMLSVCFESLAFCDFDVLPSWREQVLRGLVEFGSSVLLAFKSICQAHLRFSSSNTIRQCIKGLYETTIFQFGSSMDLNSLLSVQVSGGSPTSLEVVADWVSCIIACTSIKQSTNFQSTQRSYCTTEGLLVDDCLRVFHEHVPNSF